MTEIETWWWSMGVTLAIGIIVAIFALTRPHKRNIRVGRGWRKHD